MVPFLMRPSKRPLGLTAVPLYRVTMLAPVGEPCMASTLQQAVSNGAGAAWEQQWAAAQQVHHAVCQCSSMWLEERSQRLSNLGRLHTQSHALAALGSIARGPAQRQDCHCNITKLPHSRHSPRTQQLRQP